jgi:hypothetical protein
MANEVTIFTPQIEENIYPLFEPLRMFAKQHSVGRGAKTVSVPAAGVLDYGDVNIDHSTYPVDAVPRVDTEITYDLTKHEFKPIVIADYDEFVTNYEIRNSILQDVSGLLGAYAIRTILGGFHTPGTGTYTYATTGSKTYTNQWNDVVKNLTIEDVQALAQKLDLQKVPRDGNRYLVLPPEMFGGLMAEIADARYVDTATNAFQTGFIPNIHGFKVLMLPEVGVATINNAALRTPKTQGVAGTDCNFGYALHKNYVGFAESGVRVFVNENAADYYGTVISGSWYAGGSYVRENPIGCITVYEKAN